jgi:hypothetical protein
MLHFLLASLLLACGGRDRDPGSSDAALADASRRDASLSDSGTLDAATDAALPDAAVPSDCALLAYAGPSELDVFALRDRLVSTFHASGYTGASGEVGGESIYLQNVRFGAEGDVIEAALAFLDAETELPIARDELEVTYPNPTVRLVFRRRVGAITAPFFRPALDMHVVDDGAISSIAIRTSVLFARSEDATRLAACSPAAPPDAALRARTTTFEGLELVGCGPSGEYAYTLAPEDTVEWEGDVFWEAIVMRASSPVPLRWRPWRAARITIDPANYWPTIGRADCFCPETGAGFEALIDASTGEVISYTPGLDCVVC